MNEFISKLLFYIFEITPALALGLLLSGLVHELVPSRIIEKYLGEKGIRPILWATLVGTILPICCIGNLPLALTFYRKGSRPGPVFAFLVATPATSITALVVCYRLLGFDFTAFIFLAAILIGILVGLVADNLNIRPKKEQEDICPHCGESNHNHEHKKDLISRTISILRFGFIDLLKDIGPHILLGLVLAALVSSFDPIGNWIQNNLTGFLEYISALIFGLVMYICSTATVPLVDAFINQGLAVGAGMVLLIAGPITSYGTILVIKKEFGIKVLFIYLSLISIFAVLFGYLSSLLI